MQKIYSKVRRTDIKQGAYFKIGVGFERRDYFSGSIIATFIHTRTRGGGGAAPVVGV